MIPIEREPDDDQPCERCCFCRTVTDMWTAIPERSPGEQVACCTRCARHGTVAAVPAKADWCEREAIAMGPTLGNPDAYDRARRAYAETKVSDARE